MELLAPFVVDADDALRGIVLREEKGLRLEIRLERMMVIQMVLGQVRERRHGESRMPCAEQVECMR